MSSLGCLQAYRVRGVLHDLSALTPDGQQDSVCKERKREREKGR